MHVSADDRDFLARFATGQVSKGAFRHADHVHLAWVLLTEAPLLPALLRFRVLLQAFAARNGVDNLYNETITCFYMLLIAEAMAETNPEHSWAEFRAARPELFDQPKALLERYYPHGAAFSPAAKENFLLPEATP